MFNVAQSREFSGFQKTPEKIPEKKSIEYLKFTKSLMMTKLKI